MTDLANYPSRESIVELARSVRERGPIALADRPLTGQRLLDHALLMLADGVHEDAVRRHLERCVAAERARDEERFALLAAAFDLIASGECRSYVDFTLDGLAGH